MFNSAVCTLAFDTLYHVPDFTHWSTAVYFSNEITPGLAFFIFNCTAGFSL